MLRFSDMLYDLELGNRVIREDHTNNNTNNTRRCEERRTVLEPDMDMIMSMPLDAVLECCEEQRNQDLNFEDLRELLSEPLS